MSTAWNRTVKIGGVVSSCLALVALAAVAGRVEDGHAAQHRGHQQSPVARTATAPSVQVATGQRAGQSKDAAAAGDPSYFTPTLSGVETGDPALPVGYYWEYVPAVVPGVPERPSYMLTITQSGSDGQIAGMVYIFYEDGKLDTVFPFSGLVDATTGKGSITVSGAPTVVSYNGVIFYDQSTVQSGQQLPVVVSHGDITFPGCSNYLHWLMAGSSASPALLAAIASDPNVCTFYPTGGEAYPSESQIPVTP